MITRMHYSHFADLRDAGRTAYAAGQSVGDLEPIADKAANLVPEYSRRDILAVLRDGYWTAHARKQTTDVVREHAHLLDALPGRQAVAVHNLVDRWMRAQWDRQEVQVRLERAGCSVVLQCRSGARWYDYSCYQWRVGPRGGVKAGGKAGRAAYAAGKIS